MKSKRFQMHFYYLVRFPLPGLAVTGTTEGSANRNPLVNTDAVFMTVGSITTLRIRVRGILRFGPLETEIDLRRRRTKN
jgi:hypothetical protein